MLTGEGLIRTAPRRVRNESRSLRTGSGWPLLERHDGVLLDLDGVLYLGAEAVAGAPEAVAAARAAQVAVAFVTNNASRTPQVVADHLTGLGIGASAQDVVTSAQAAVAIVAAAVPPGSPVLLVGGEGLREALTARGLRPVRQAQDHPVAVVQGFSPDLGWADLAQAVHAVHAGLPWVATNLDVTVPTAQGLAPGNGALVEAVAIATGRRPVAAGKPEAALYTEAVRRLGVSAPLVVGDRLDTDVEGADRAGLDSLLVLTGVTSPVDLALAPAHRRPTYVSTDLLSGLTRAHPPVRRREAHVWTCGNWVCTVTGSGVSLVGSGPWLDGLRALSLACWDGGVVDPAMVREAVAGLRL